MKEEQSKRRALGMGLEQLFNTEVLDFNNIENKIIDETPKDEIVELDLNELMPNPYQPRKQFDDTKINELADSIRLHGVFTPILVKKAVKGYELVTG